MVNLGYHRWQSTIYCNKEIVRARIAQYAAAIHNKGAPLQSVWPFPDGTKVESCRISANASGAGSCHDVTLLRVSKLLQYFEANEEIFRGYFIYGDPAYPISKWIISGYKGANLDEHKDLFNSSMSRVRKGVE
ncbi:hypothetical protein H257_09943 [Aphanomyces astaci]|uniref:DDE Tnp4 domain-containing protein n=1 Tax=Aphanomyces astaci TaxID=112090 RepID=W4GA89_APHAT|nr:hypothetical protein H257_09943 [Aphanomyces astaci]ETV75989.1 hypothetical protein H257_09943 [Aphanomyces astaci]|eukprot:XP_009834631.1 hypothetical protein H257_09943 [Aphanomyces astaci]